MRMSLALVPLVLCSVDAFGVSLAPGPEVPSFHQEAEITIQIGRAIAVVHSEDFNRADRRKKELERKMGLRDSSDNLIRQPTKEDLSKLSCFWGDECEEYAQALRVYQEAKEKETEHYNEAIRLARSYYRIKVWPAGEAASGGPWVRRKRLEYDPRFSLVPEWGEKEDVEDAFQEQPSCIGSDGSIKLRPAAFVDREGRPDPATLALILQHESYHMQFFLTPDMDSVVWNEPWVERDLRMQALIQEDRYQLASGDWAVLLKNAVGYDLLGKQWADYWRIKGENPYEYMQNYRAITFTEEKKAEISRTVDQDLQSMSIASGIMEDHGAPEALEYLRARAQTEFIRQLDDQSLTQVFQGWKQARELARQKAQPQRRFEMLLAHVGAEARHCGLNSLDLSNGYRYGLQVPDPFSPGGDIRWTGTHLYYKWDTPLDGAKVVMMLARACQDINPNRYRDRDIESTCNEGLDIINQRWNDPEFRRLSDLEVSGDGFFGTCFDYLASHMKSPLDLDGLNGLLKSARTEYVEGNRQRYNEAQRRQAEDDRRRQQREHEDGGGGYDGPCGNGGSLCGSNQPHL